MQAGIREVVVSTARMAEYSSDYYNQHFGNSEVLLKEAGVIIRRHPAA